MKKNIIQNRRIEDDMHYTKGIENKNDGLIDWKRNTKKKLKGRTEIAVLQWDIGFSLSQRPWRN